MSAVALGHHRYGKSRVRLVHVDRTAPRHVVTELSVDVYLWGEFANSFLVGDNSTTVPTDTMKNTVYALAKLHPVTPVESFAVSVAEHFVSKYSQVSKCKVEITQPQWTRMAGPNGGAEKTHLTAFESEGPWTRCVTAETSPTGTCVTSGFDNLRVLKTTGSGFEGFPRCEYTTLPEMHDRLLCTAIKARWTFAGGAEPGYAAAAVVARNVVTDFFANRYSLSVQQLVYEAGEEILKRVPEIDSVTLVMPNIHVFTYDIERFGLVNNDEVYYPVDDPAGYIEGTVVRASGSGVRSKL